MLRLIPLLIPFSKLKNQSLTNFGKSILKHPYYFFRMHLLTYPKVHRFSSFHLSLLSNRHLAWLCMVSQRLLFSVLPRLLQLTWPHIRALTLWPLGLCLHTLLHTLPAIKPRERSWKT